ncbi:FAD/NAD(P)-binding domain-containing protein [Hypoxylon cercidicola]|nr:FAD/NAD(P)-binding domain-containing protein [Hypoxylon cercidicola]
MMADCDRFRVIIAGGGIAGLTLANALDKAGVDFIVLEKYEIAPQLGASIAIVCHTARIFEQLGVWKAMCATTSPLTARHHLDERGTLFDDSPIFQLLLDKTNWPTVFMERRVCLEVLYGNIKDKSRIRANVGIASYIQTKHGITVITDRGESIQGSILVGADGVHSKVRSLLADSISEDDPERRRNLLEGFTSSYRTIFGTSPNGLDGPEPRRLLPHGIAHHVYHRGASGITAAGGKGLIFWFLFVKEPSTSTSPNCPRYTPSDVAATMEKYGDLVACPGYNFRDLWESSIKSGMVPMEEGVIQGPWNNDDRVVLVGDATCKITINAGLGGNLAVEGVCRLVNELVPLLRRTQTPTTREIVASFERYERMQRPRADLTFDMAHLVTRYESMDSLWLRILRWLSPWIPLRFIGNIFLDYMKPAPILNFLPDPDDPSPSQSPIAVDQGAEMISE